jgi:hypothetical protein
MDKNKTNPKGDVVVAEEKVVETETTQSNPPQDEKPITGAETTSGESVDQDSTVESSDVSSTMTEEQRRAFQEMRLENKRLKEEKESSEPKESAFDMFRAQTPPVSQIGPVRIEQYQDSITGETNWQAYNLAQQQREQQILQQARFEAQQTTSELMDEDKARTKYPDLFNDKVTEKQIASRWFYEKAQGNNVSISDIAGEFARNFKQAVSKAEKIGAERALNEVSEKEQAGLVAESQTSSPANQAASALDQENLIMRTRKGDPDAIAARISKIPWANK